MSLILVSGPERRESGDGLVWSRRAAVSVHKAAVTVRLMFQTVCEFLARFPPYVWDGVNKKGFYCMQEVSSVSERRFTEYAMFNKASIVCRGWTEQERLPLYARGEFSIRAAFQTVG